MIISIMRAKTFRTRKNFPVSNADTLTTFFCLWAAQARDRGRPASDNELGVVMAQIRKFLSTAFVRAQGLCLINRLCFLGEGARAAAWRRDLAKRLEVSRKRDLMAHYQAHIRGQGLARVGQIFVP